MSKTELKQDAQDRLMYVLEIAYYQVGDDPEMTEEEKEALSNELTKQINRVKKLFGYETN